MLTDDDSAFTAARVRRRRPHLHTRLIRNVTADEWSCGECGELVITAVELVNLTPTPDALANALIARGTDPAAVYEHTRAVERFNDTGVFNGEFVCTVCARPPLTGSKTVHNGDRCPRNVPGSLTAPCPGDYRAVLKGHLRDAHCDRCGCNAPGSDGQPCACGGTCWAGTVTATVTCARCHAVLPPDGACRAC